MPASISSTAQKRESASPDQQAPLTTPVQPQQVSKSAAASAPSATVDTTPSIASSNSNTIKRTDLAAADESLTTKSKDKAKKRGLFGFGKKKTDEKKTEKQPKPFPSAAKSPSNMSSTPVEHPYKSPSSPGRALSASSPRLISPAGSQIFERDVQESQHLPNSPAIPNHISTENYIPPVLDASSEAITDDHLNTDTVEIVTHASHLPAAASLSGMPSMDNLSSAWEPDMQSLGGEKDDSASNYGSFESTDVRRLSFISFADVVQAEQASHIGGQPGSRDSIHLAGLTSLSSMSMNRSSSPMRSPVSSQGLGTSPPTSKSGSVKGLEMSPSRKPIGSPTSMHHSLAPGGSEVNVETMTQALRRTGSADLSGVRSIPTSPVDGPSR